MARKITPQEPCAFCEKSPCECATTDKRRKPKSDRRVERQEPTTDGSA